MPETGSRVQGLGALCESCGFGHPSVAEILGLVGPGLFVVIAAAGMTSSVVLLLWTAKSHEMYVGSESKPLTMESIFRVNWNFYIQESSV